MGIGLGLLGYFEGMSKVSMKTGELESRTELLRSMAKDLASSVIPNGLEGYWNIRQQASLTPCMLSAVRRPNHKSRSQGCQNHCEDLETCNGKGSVQNSYPKPEPPDPP